MSKYDFKKIERKWQKKWVAEKVYEPKLKGQSASGRSPFYNLMMFPYPSAEGLHVGNMYAFTGADIYGRFKRMQGYDVFQPIGLDGFGIHSENYALKIGTHPAKQSKISEKRFYEQLASIGNGFAWNERLETYDPEYYKWTQWIFAEMFRKGLAYRKKQAVNWCPSCKTVLADEQVIQGKCERCGTVVVKKDLEQWFFRITKYADRLLNDLKNLDWSERVKIAQENWIGRSEGALIKFPISNSQFSITVFTTRPDTLFGATYLVLSPEHKALENNELGIMNYEEVERYVENAKKKSETERIAERMAKTGAELKGVKAINLANNEEVPIWMADYVLCSYGTGAIMAVPGEDKRDYEFAKVYKLPVKIVTCLDHGVECKAEAAWEGENHLVNSGKFTGMKVAEAKWEITKFVGGERKVQYRLRDWLISRQRYWGPPIPLVFCENCAGRVMNNELGIRNKISKGEVENPGWVPVPEKDLPVKLPVIKDFKPLGTGKSPLVTDPKFYKTKCPRCGGPATRETDVSDTFLDSAWYYLRYLDPKNKAQPFDKLRARKWLPIDLYTGGAEHSVLHLLYVRFLAKVFHDWKLVDFDEPAKKFRAHGLLIKNGAKMSKSKGNVINPDEYIKKFGADTLRMYLMFLAPFEQGGDFRDSGILGVERFLQRAWKLFVKLDVRSRTLDGQNKDFERLLHKTIKKVTEDIENLNYNTAVSAMMILLNEMEKQKILDSKHYLIFTKLLAPFAPHLTEEIWQMLRGQTRTNTRTGAEVIDKSAFKSVHLEEWPKYDPKLIKDEKFNLIIQINGKVRDSVEVEAGISQAEVEKLVLVREKVQTYLNGGKPKKVIYVAGRLINLVV